MSGKTITKISKPIRMWIDGKCLNIKQFKEKTKKDKQSVKKEAITNEEPNNTPDVLDPATVFENELNISMDSQGKFSTTCELPPLYYIKLLNFHKEYGIDALKVRTKTEIYIPKYGNSGKLVISGGDEQGIKEAIDQIYSAVGEIRDRHMALQFVGIPLLNDQLKENFNNFKSEILANKSIKGVEESIFQKPEKLHLTIDIFVLLDEREKSEAISALQDYKNSYLSPLLEKTGPLKIKVEGIDCMNDDYTKVNILYANVKIADQTEETNLQKIVNDLNTHFYERGFLKRYQENVKLHVTLMNTKYRKVTNSPRRRWPPRQPFDATSIMEKYKDFHFGTCDLSSIHISYISSKGEDGFYKPLTIIKLH